MTNAASAKSRPMAEKKHRHHAKNASYYDDKPVQLSFAFDDSARQSASPQTLAQGETLKV